VITFCCFHISNKSELASHNQIKYLSNTITNHIKELDEKDHLEMRASKLERLYAIMPNVANTVKNNDEAIQDILFNIELYKDIRLNADMRITIRKKVVELVTRYQLSGSSVDDFIEYLKNIGAY